MDVRAKGYHINSDAGELGLRPFRRGDGSIGVNVVTAMGDHPIDPNVAAGAIKFVQNEQGKVANQLRGIISNHSHNQAFDGRVNEARMLLEWLGATP